MTARFLEGPEIDPTTVAAWERHVGYHVDDPEELRARLGRGSLPEAFAESAVNSSRRPALRVGGRTVTHGEIDDAAGRAATRLAALGLKREDRLLLIADVGIEEIVAYLGAMRLGATVVLANPALTSFETVAMVADSEASMIVGSGPHLVEAAVGETVREVVGLRPEDGEHASVVLNLSGVPSMPPGPIPPDAVAILAFTSGTTGSPKPTPLTHGNLLASIRGVMMAWSWSHADHLIHSLPISHQHGLGGVHATLLAGSRATLLGKFDAEATLSAVKDHGASIHFGVAAIHQRLIEHLGDRSGGLASLRLAISGSGPLPVDVFDSYRSATGTDLLERYGTTESGLDVSNPYDGQRRAGQVGLPLPGVELALMGDGGEAVTDGVGEILIRGPQVFSGYWDVADSDQPFIGDWFRTGDLGVVDERTGYLRIVGRSKEVIITGGMNVHPREVEDVLRSIPEVVDVAVLGVDSQDWGEEVVAFVTPASVEPDRIATFLTSRLAAYKRPKRIVPVASIPRSPVGKLIPGDLTSMIAPDG